MATSLGAFGSHLQKAGKLSAAAAAFREGTDLVRPHAEKFPEGPATKLLVSLEHDLREPGDQGES